jgi:hypothetical protein
MLDLLWRTSFRWKITPRQVTGDSAYGSTENIAAVEQAGIRAYVPLTGAGKARPYFSKEEFVYDPEQDLYQCPAGEILSPKTFRAARNQILYKTEPGRCDSCSMRAQCTDNKTGRQVLRHLEERYVDRVKSYRGTFAYEKALRKRRAWVEPLFGEAKDWHGLRRFRLRRLEKVNIEALLIACGQNIKRLVAARERGPRKLAQAAVLRPVDPLSRCRTHVSGRWPSFAGARRISTGCRVKSRSPNATLLSTSIDVFVFAELGQTATRRTEPQPSHRLPVRGNLGSGFALT